MNNVLATQVCIFKVQTLLYSMCKCVCVHLRMGACTCVGGVVQAICIRITIGMKCTDSIYIMHVHLDRV